MREDENSTESADSIASLTPEQLEEKGYTLQEAYKKIGGMGK
mgnify:CR=1 FL=1